MPHHATSYELLRVRTHTHTNNLTIRTGSILRNQVHAHLQLVCTWLKKGIGIKSEKYANKLGIKWYGSRFLRYSSRVALD